MKSHETVSRTCARRTVTRLAGAVVALAWTSLAAAQTNPPSTPPTGGRDLVAMTFAATPIGSFPVGLEKVAGAMEVVMKDGQPMLRATERSTFRINLPEVLPQDFTLEFDLVPKTCCQPEDIAFEGTAVINQGNASANVQWHHEHQMVVGGGPTHSSKVPDDIAVSLPGVMTNIVFTMQGDQMTMFTNGQRLYTIQRKFARSRVLRVFLGGQNDTERAVYLARLRVAATTGATTASTGIMTGRSPGTTLAAVPSGFGITVTLGGTGPIVTWPPVPGATAYRASRRKFDDVTCCNAAAITATSPWQDQPLPMSGTYVYQVIASTPNGDVMAETQFGYRQPLGPVPTSPTPVLVNTNTTTTATATPIPAPVTALPPAPTTGTATPLSSRFRLVALGFKVISTGRDLDDARDGRGDEVYLAAIANQTKLTGGPLPVTKPPTSMLAPAMTRTHGDEAVSVPYGRIKAGTASSTGGLQAGDVVPPALDLTTATGALQQQTFPFKLWEGNLDAPDDVAVVHLALWDDDVNPTVQAEWLKMISQTAQSGYATGPSYIGGASATGDQIWAYTQPKYDNWGYIRATGDLLNTCLIGPTPFFTKWGLCEVDGVDHPIGSHNINQPPAQWKDYFILLTRKLAENGVSWAFDHWPALAGEFAGTFSVNLRDFSLYPYIPSAQYELYLRLERIP